MPTRAEKLTEGEHLGTILKKVLRKVFLEDWAMKLMALVITFALWVGVTGLSQPAVQRMNGIPLALRYSENVVATSPTEELDIVISGDKRKIDQINKNDLIVSLDLTGTQPGDRVVQLTPTTISLTLPNGIKIDEITPRQITVKIEPLEVKQVPVNPITVGQVADGFEVYGQAANPPRINVRGPANMVRPLAMVTTEKIDLTNKKEDFTARQVTVNVSNAGKVTPLESFVDVTFRIGERRMEKAFSVQADAETKRKVTVVLYGGRSILDSVKPEDLTVQFVKDPSGNEKPVVSLPQQLVDRVEIRRPKPSG